MATEDIVFAQTSGSMPWEGAMKIFTENEAFAANAPFVKAHRDLFGPEPTKVRDRGIERATRAPGERRG